MSPASGVSTGAWHCAPSVSWLCLRWLCVAACLLPQAGPSLAASAENVATTRLPGAPPQCSASVVSKIAWGVGSGAYNVEGAVKQGGRADSVWDVFIRKPGATADGSSGEVAADFYRRYKSDIRLMQQLGIKHFRFSISWSRLIPAGVQGSAINKAGVDYYNSLINSLLGAGITPIVAIYHWDLPQALQTKYQGFISPNIVDDYLYFADACFKLFGDRVRSWWTFIEPWVICSMQYGNGQYAPGTNYGAQGE